MSLYDSQSQRTVIKYDPTGAISPRMHYASGSVIINELTLVSRLDSPPRNTSPWPDYDDMISREEALAALLRKNTRDNRDIGSEEIGEIDFEYQQTEMENDEEDEVVAKRRFVVAVDNLRQYVANHLKRKLLQNWFFIDQQFSQSSVLKEIKETKADGSVAKRRLPALHLSALTAMLCSSKISVTASEIFTLYKFMDIPEDIIENSLRLTGVRMIIAANDSGNIHRQYYALQAELERLGKVKDRAIVLEKIKKYAFSEDPSDREKEMEYVRAFKNELSTDENQKNLKEELALKMKERARKAMHLFEDSYLEVQYVKGLFLAAKSKRFRDLVDHCTRVFVNSCAPTDAIIPKAVITNVTIEFLPAFIQDLVRDQTSNRVAAFRQKSMIQGHSLKHDDRVFFRVNLHGPPTVVDRMKTSIMLNKGLNGCTVTDAIEMLQAYCAIIIQSGFRRHRRHWRYSKARGKWKHIFAQVKELHFSIWRNSVAFLLILKKRVLRHVIAWKHYTNRAKERRALFRSCFWPFFVWRRSCIADTISRQKIRFLVYRLLPTYRQLTIFRAWKRQTKRMKEILQVSSLFSRSRSLRLGKEYFQWFRWWVRQRIKIRHAWYRRGGFIMMKKHFYALVGTPFQLWYAYSFYRSQAKARLRLYGAAFGKTLFAPRNPLPAPNRIELQRKLREEQKLRAEASESIKNLGMMLNKKSAKYSGKDIEKKIQSILEISDSRPNTPSRFTKIYKGDFAWVGYTAEPDVESDIEEVDHLPRRLENLYFQSLDPFLDADETGNNRICWISDDVISRVKDIGSAFRVQDSWYLLEFGSRYHRVVARAFQNLKHYAQVHHNAKMSLHMHRMKIKRIVFERLLEHLVEFDTITKFNLGDSPNSLSLRSGDTLRASLRAARWGIRRRRQQLNRALRMRSFAEAVTEIQEEIDYVAREEENYRKENLKRRFRLVASKGRRVASVAYDMNPRNSPLAKSKAFTISAATTATDGPVVAPSSLTIKNALAHSKPSRLKMSKQYKQQLLDPLDSTTKRLHRGVGTNYESLTEISPPKDISVWDREDTDEIHERLAALVDHSSHVGKRVVALVGNLSLSNEEARIDQQLRVAAVKDVLDEETSVVAKAVEDMNEYAKNFKVHAAEFMVKVFMKIVKENASLKDLQTMKKGFRMLRVPVLTKFSVSMFNSKKIMNWLRLCKRFHKIYVMMPKYYRQKKMYTTFYRWLKLLEKESTETSPGFVNEVKRVRNLYFRFTHFLEANDIKRIVYIGIDRLDHIVHETKSIFLRWSMLTQGHKVDRTLDRLARQFYVLKVMRKHFLAVRMSCSPTDVKRILQKPSTCFGLVRVQSDIDALAKRVLPVRKYSVYEVVKRYNRKYRNLLKSGARKIFSFKTLSSQFLDNFQKRSETLSKLLIEHFRARGRQIFIDVVAPVHLVGSNNIMPLEIIQLHGVRFSDPMNESFFTYYKDDKLVRDEKEALNGGISDRLTKTLAEKRVDNIHQAQRNDWSLNPTKEGLPAGYFLHKVILNFEIHAGIVGWQVVWSADGAIDMASPKRGKWTGGSFSSTVILIPQGDFVLGVRYYTFGTLVIGMMLKLMIGGWTILYGRDSYDSFPAPSVYLGVEMSPKQQFEDEYPPFGSDEIETPGLPTQCIIGFTGVEVKDCASCLGIVVRKFQYQHIFSYLWVKDALAEKELERERELALRASNRRIAVKSKSSQVDKISLASISTSSSGEKVEKELSESEVQFFDILSMRTMEIEAAKDRALSFARVLWMINNRDPASPLMPLTPLRVISQLTAWLFNALSKRLEKVCLTEEHGADLMRKVADLLNSAAVQANQIIALKRQAASLAKTIDSKWHASNGSNMLSPDERQEKITMQQYIEKNAREIRYQEQECVLLRKEASQLTATANKYLPRLRLSQFSLSNYMTKVLACRQKQLLLQVTNVETVKSALVVEEKISVVDSAIDTLRWRQGATDGIGGVAATGAAGTNVLPFRRLSMNGSWDVHRAESPFSSLGDLLKHEIQRQDSDPRFAEIDTCPSTTESGVRLPHLGQSLPRSCGESGIADLVIGNHRSSLFTDSIASSSLSEPTSRETLRRVSAINGEHFVSNISVITNSPSPATFSHRPTSSSRSRPNSGHQSFLPSL